METKNSKLFLGEAKAFLDHAFAPNQNPCALGNHLRKCTRVLFGALCPLGKAFAPLDDKHWSNTILSCVLLCAMDRISNFEFRFLVDD